ncbi:MAG: glycosyltransferase [Chitinophagaceae bacterium]
MTEKPAVSVVMCTYNGENFLRDQLNSILQQTYPINEIIIVDDCSADNTVQIIQEYLQQNVNIKFYQNKKNLGYTKNFEKALLLATHDLISISDQDDMWHKQKIEKLIDNWKEDTLLIYCDSVRFENEIPLNAKPNPKYKRFFGTDPRKISLYNTVSGHAMIIRKLLLQLALPVPKNIFYDWWFAVVAACNGGVSYVPQTLVYQRKHSRSVTANLLSDYTIKQEYIFFKQEVNINLAHFITLPNINERDKTFFEKLYYLWNRSATKKFDAGLFFFLMKYRKIVYSRKIKITGFLSHLKYSFFCASCPYQ